MKRLLREPLLHFLLIGAGLFALFHYMRPHRDTSPTSRQIQFSLDELSQLALLFQSQWRREPTVDELDHLVENKVQQEVLYREALTMGLDKGDEIVKRRMAQKMQFLAEDVANNSQKFAIPARFSFRHLYFSTDRRGEHARDDAAKALAQLTGQPEDSKLAASLADPFMFQDYYRDRAQEYLGKEFGPRFAESVEKLTPGSWQGPVESGYGWHLVFVDTVIPARTPTLEEVESDVKTAWLSQQKAQAWEKAYKEIRAKYMVLLPVVPEKTQQEAEARDRKFQTSSK